MPKIETYTADGRLKQDTGAAFSGTAEDVSIADAGGYTSETDVEAALQELYADAVEGNSTTLGGGAFRNSIRSGDQVWTYTDFMGVPSVVANTTFKSLGDGFSARTSGTSSGVNTDPTTVDAANALGHEHPGVVVMSTGTNAAGVTTIGNAHESGSASSLSGSMWAGTGKMRMGCWLYIPTLSSAAGSQQFNVRVGFLDRDTQAQSSGNYFRYKDDVNSGNWEFVREVATVETAADTGITVAGATWYYMEVEISADGEDATFYIDNSQVGTVSAIAEGVVQFAGVQIGKTVGTTTRHLYVDAIWAMMGVNR